MNATDDPYDILVIGAGPAGSFAAHHAALAGRRVLLIDRADFPRDKVCGDGLNPRSCAVLAEAGVDARRLEAAGAVRIEGYRKFRAGDRVDEPIAPRAGWADHAYGLPRLTLDRLLQAAALAAGAGWAGGFEVKSVGIEGGQWVTARGVIGRRPVRASGRLAIIASGASAAYYRGLGSQPRRAGGAIAGGLRQYFAVPAISSPTFDFYELPGLPGGYAWLFPVGEGVVNVGVWSRGGAEGHRGLRQALLTFLQSEPAVAALAGGRPLGAPRGAILRPLLSAHLSSDRLLWVGDGAGLTHRETGQGISYALESGRQAAAVAGEALRAGRGDAGALQPYDEWIRQQFANELLGWRRAGPH